MQKKSLDISIKIPIAEANIILSGNRFVLGTGFGVDITQKQADDIFDAFVQVGGTFIDTALVYHNSEEKLGNWLKRRRNSSNNIKICAKGAHHENGMNRVLDKEIRLDVEYSLKKLDLDNIDIFLLHRDDPDESIEGIVYTLNSLIKEGKILNYGLSNWTIPRIAELVHFCHKNNYILPVSSSPQLCLAFPKKTPWDNCVHARDSFSLEWYADANLPLFAWGSLSMGYFNTAQPHGGFATNPWQQRLQDLFESKKNIERKRRCEELALLYNVTPTQLSYSWVLNIMPNIYGIAGCRTAEQVFQIFNATKISLTNREMKYLDLQIDQL